MKLLPFHGALAPGADTIDLGAARVQVPAVREALPETALVLGVRPEHVRLAAEGGLRGRVNGTEYLGTTQIVTVTTTHGAVKARLPSATPVAAGETVGLTFRPQKLSLFDKASGRAIRTALHDAPSAGGAHG